MNVFVTGAGRDIGLGINFVKRYLEEGNTVFATVHNPSEAIKELEKQYPDTLHVLTVDIASTESVKKAAEEVAKYVDVIDLLINNAVTASRQSGWKCTEIDPDEIPRVMDVDAVGPLRVIRALLPMIEKSEAALIVNISSEAGSIGKCFRVNSLDYAMAKCALNMMTMTFRNYFNKEVPNVNIICVHPGWMRTRPNSPAPLDPYEDAEMMRVLFEKLRRDKDGPVFVTNYGEEYPW